MPTSQQHITQQTPMGANLVSGGGATFRVWAPAAREVYVITDELTVARQPGWAPQEEDRLVRQQDGAWTGFVPALSEGARYRFWVVGEGSSGFKRDPYARELSIDPPFPDCDCLILDPQSYPWHDRDYRTPQFADLMIYQLHIGTFYAVDEQGRDVRLQHRGKFLDLLDRIEYLQALGINAIQPLPIQEFPSQFSLGYNGTDYFSPEMDYQVNPDDTALLQRYLDKANSLLARHNQAPLTLDQLRPGGNQLKVVIDLYHLHGIAVILDLVYNHAGGDFGDQSLYFLDRQVFHSNNDSLYFTDQGLAGGLVFAYWNEGVRQFLMDNAEFFLEEYHIDGIRYDEVSVIDNHGGWSFCQNLATRCRSVKPGAIQIAEYWNDRRWLAVNPTPGGMGFDAALADGLRDRLREALGQATGGRNAAVNLDPVRDNLYAPQFFPNAWRAVQCLENHDVVFQGRERRVAALAGGNDSRSWYARSRSRAATGLLLTAPGIPMLFMGQEFLEANNWCDNTNVFPNDLVSWEALQNNRDMQDFQQFTQDLLELRRRYPALRGERINAFHVHNINRVLAWHRWLDGVGQDVVVVMSLNESTFWHYELGFPRWGRWREVFNSDFYDQLPNPWVTGNGGSVMATGPSRHGLPSSATIVIPANSMTVFAWES